MGLSRLENFLKNARGNILYVSPNDLDSTDSVENKGNSLTRPFKTIQRALIEASRFSYQRGLNNDRFGQTTILLYPGDHVIDNRPGWIPNGSGSFVRRDGTSSSDFSAWDLTTVFDLTNANNALYKLNSVNGGVIVPRGTSIVGYDLRKTKIRPKYVPSPTNDDIETSAIFRVTGECYFWQFSMFDADPNGTAFIDYTANTFVPNFSHHKLTAFEYADGVNNVVIKDSFQTLGTNRTDLQMYYEKVGLVYGTASGRAVEPDYPSSAIDIEPKVDEYRIVGSTGASVGITSIKAGNGVVSSDIITVTTAEAVSGLDVDTPFVLDGVTATGYDGKYVVSEKVNTTQFKYQVQNAPVDPLPSVTGSTVELNSDTVTSSSPYIFNCSVRSVYGINGLHADGAKATGFKSMVAAQFTGIGLQKDDNAFIKYNTTTGVYDDATVPGNENLSVDSQAIFKPSYANQHIRCSNDAVLQLVSVFCIGYAKHFYADSGGDMSITNSNSNFGAKSLVARGYKANAFSQDDLGYVSHIIPPKEIPVTENAIEFNAVDIEKTVGIASTAHLYLYNQTNLDAPPENVLDGYRVGAREQDTLKVLVPNAAGTATEYSSRIVMPGSQDSREKVFTVNRSSAGINSITEVTNIVTLTGAHTLDNGESVRILSDNGRLPDGLKANTVYYAITDANASAGLSTNTDIKLAKTETDALNANALAINNLGGTLTIVSRVSDKNSGEIGHPVQWDSAESQWYIKVSTASTDNDIFNTVCVGLGTTSLGDSTPRTYIKRKSDTRNANDTTYRLRYVIPASSGGAVGRPPTDGYIVQESNTGIGATDAEIQTYFGSGSLSNENQQRNFRFIANSRWASNTAHILTELPHNLSVDSQVELINVKSTVNTVGSGNSGYNGTFPVTGITSAREFTVGIATDAGTFTSDTLARNTSLPYFKRKRYKTTYYIQGTEETQKYIQGKQDGIYYLTVLNASNNPAVDPFTSDKFSQPIKNLYPQTDRDNPNSDPDGTLCYALSETVGDVIVDDVRKSVTKETIDKFITDIDVGIGLTDIVTSTGGTFHRFNTSIDHGFNRITAVSIASSGTGYGTEVDADYYNAKLVSIGSSTTGSNATAKVTVDATGGITAVKIMDGGSAYGIGNTLNVVGIATTGTHQSAVITVDGVYDNVGDSVRITGLTSESYRGYNTVYRISEVHVGGGKSFTAISDTAITGVTNTGIGSIPLDKASAYLTGQSVKINNISYNPTSGLATVTSVDAHGLKANSKVRIHTGIATLTTFDGDFVVNQNVDLTNFIVKIGIDAGTEPVAAGASMFVLRNGVTSNDGIPTIENESINGRMVPTYAGITTTLSVAVADAITTEVRLTGIGTLGIEMGDYLSIDDEIVRIKTTPANPVANPLYVFRAVLGTRATSHLTGSVVRRVSPLPIELRRHSLNRASGHTWEYVGYGPGNYSTGLPDKQNRDVTDVEETLAQTTRMEGGANYFTGMNDKGISFSGNKRLSTVTGKEEVFNTPIRSVTGEDISEQSSINLTKATEGTFTKSIRVDGGAEGKSISEFTGPVVFSNKITSSSARGFEATHLFLQGDSTVSRKLTVGIATPVTAGTPGDITFFENPTQGENAGWVYTADKDWKRFGSVSLEKEQDYYVFDKAGVAIGAASSSADLGKSSLIVGAGASCFASSEYGVGIGTTNSGDSQTFKLHVIGDTQQLGDVNITGICSAAYFYGDGNNLTNLDAAATGWSGVKDPTGVGQTGIFAAASGKINEARVGIGTSVPQYNVHLGSPGTGRTDLYVTNKAIVAGQADLLNTTITGIITATSFRFDDSSTGWIRAGVGTFGTGIVVGSSAAKFTITGDQVGVGTASPRAKVDIDGSLKIKTSSENVHPLSISAGNVDVDLSKGQTFTLTVDAAVTQFTLLNPPDDATAFTIKFLQNSTGYSVDIDDFRDSSGNTVDVYWPAGGVIPVVTSDANKIDIYSFKSFDSGNSLYGIVGGQNFVA